MGQMSYFQDTVVHFFTHFLIAVLFQNPLRIFWKRIKTLRKNDNLQLPFEPWNWKQYWAVMKGNKRNMYELWLLKNWRKLTGATIPKSAHSLYMGHSMRTCMNCFMILFSHFIKEL